MISLFTSLVHYFLGKWYLQFFIVTIKDVFQHVFENVHRKGNFFQYKRIQKLNSFEVQPQHQLENSWIKWLSHPIRIKVSCFDSMTIEKNGGLNKRSNDSGTLQKQSVPNEDSQRAWHFFSFESKAPFLRSVFIPSQKKWQCLEALFFLQGLFKIT